LTAADKGGSGVAATYYRIDKAPEQLYTVPIKLAEGEHELEFWSADKAGNTEEKNTATVQIDLSDPTLTVTAPTKNSSTSATAVTVQGTAEDAVSGVTDVTVDGRAASFDPDEGEFELADVELTCGPNTLVVEATNAAGRTAQVPVSVTRRCAAVTDMDNPLRASKQGDININDIRGNRVVPVKVGLEYLDEPYTGGDPTLGNPTITLRALPSCKDKEGEVAADVDSAGNANTDDQFRWSGGKWIYNLSSRDLEAGTCYRVDVHLDGVRASNDLWAVLRVQ
jgi:hypothetical protein